MNIEADAPMEGTPLIRPSTTDHPLYDQVVEACRTVFDPEIPVNIYDLGLVYTVEITPENDVTVAMTLTAPGLPGRRRDAGLGGRGDHADPRRAPRRRRAGLGAAVGHGHDVRRGAARARLHVSACRRCGAGGMVAHAGKSGRCPRARGPVAAFPAIVVVLTGDLVALVQAARPTSSTTADGARSRRRRARDVDRRSGSGAAVHPLSRRRLAVPRPRPCVRAARRPDPAGTPRRARPRRSTPGSRSASGPGRCPRPPISTSPRARRSSFPGAGSTTWSTRAVHDRLGGPTGGRRCLAAIFALADEISRNWTPGQAKVFPGSSWPGSGRTRRRWRASSTSPSRPSPVISRAAATGRSPRP